MLKNIYRINVKKPYERPELPVREENIVQEKNLICDDFNWELIFCILQMRSELETFNAIIFYKKK